MNPLQEYCLRNKIDTPYVLYGNCQLLLKNPTKVRICEKYRLFHVKSVNKGGDNGANIGRFEISYMMPRNWKSGWYDGFLEQFKKDIELVVYWQDYGNQILEKVSEWSSLGLNPVSDNLSLKIACWELLNHVQDGNFSTLPRSILELNYLILSSKNSLEDSSLLIDRCLDLIKSYSSASENYAYSNILKSWEYFSELMIHTKNSHWLVKLTKGEPCWN